MARHDAAYVPAFKTQIVACNDCGAAVEVGGKRRKPARCPACACRALEEACTQISQGAGPYAERRLEGYRKMLARETGT